MLSSSLKIRLAAVMTLLVTLTLAGVTFLTLQASRRALVEQVGATLRGQAVLLSDLFTLFFQEKSGHLEALAVSEGLVRAVRERNLTYTGTAEEAAAQIAQLDAQWIAAAPDDPLIAGIIEPARNSQAAQLLAFLAQFNEHTEVFITDRHGATVAATGKLSDYQQADEDWWQAAWNGGTGAIYISEPAYDSSAGVHALKLAVPLRESAGGEVIGVLRSTLNVDRLFQLVARGEFGESGRALLFNAQGKGITDSRKAPDSATAELPLELERAMASNPQGFTIARESDGAEAILGYAVVHEAQTGGALRAALERLAWRVVARQRADEALGSAGSVRRASLQAGLVAVGLAALAGLLVARTITRPLVELGAAAGEVGAGNLDANMPRAKAAELQHLIGSFAEMTGKLRHQRAEILRGVDALREQTGDIRAVISVLAPSADGILQSSKRVAANAAQTADAIDDTMATVAELRQTAQHASEAAREVAETAQHAAQVSESGKAATESSAQGMRRIREQMESIGRSMLELSQHTQAIGEIISVVDELAQSSNLLAVNAAIEAARAGQHGKGFAVVAQEVKHLADQSREATTQVRTILQAVQQATAAATLATEQGAKAVEAGAGQSNAAGESIVRLADTVTQASRAATQIAAASAEQLTGIAHMSQAMEGLKDASNQNVGSAQQLETAARELTTLGRKLGELAERHQTRAS